VKRQTIGCDFTPNEAKQTLGKGEYKKKSKLTTQPPTNNKRILKKGRGANIPERKRVKSIQLSQWGGKKHRRRGERWARVKQRKKNRKVRGRAPRKRTEGHKRGYGSKRALSDCRPEIRMDPNYSGVERKKDSNEAKHPNETIRKCPPLIDGSKRRIEQDLHARRSPDGPGNIVWGPRMKKKFKRRGITSTRVDDKSTQKMA